MASWTQDLRKEALVKLAAAAEVALKEAGEEMVGAIRDSFHEEKTGRVYEWGPPPLPHQASAPFEPPAVWTGDLEESLKAEVVGTTTVKVSEGSDAAPHAEVMEFGSSDGRIEARPHFGIALDDIAFRLAYRLQKALAKVTK